ncbi:MAG: glycosyltransferase family 1 protein [Planctomycetes bacterium]|nr:glycosyltransferase family 1 protein [Planctomycetota bacterium]
MTGKIGFFKSNLQDTFPRGARRAARAIVEIVNTSPKNTQALICLDEKKIPNSRPTSFFFDPLNDWLKNNPLTQTANPNYSFPLSVIKKIARLCLPPIFYPLIKAIVNFGRKSLIKLKNFLSKITKKIAAEPFAEIELSQKIIALCELDAFVAFEPFNEIWKLPVENNKALAIGWFYDAVPKRIHEGEHWRPDLFDGSVSIMALRAGHIFCDSKSAESDLHYFFPASVGKTSVIHLGHDIERFEKRLSDSDATKMLRDAGVDPAIPYFLFVGTVEPRKNITGILLAAQKLKQIKSNVSFQIVLIGQIPGQHDIRRVIKQTNELLPVHALEYLPDNQISTFMNHANGFVFPSKWEGFGIPNLEAMTSETLVITSELGPMPEVCGEHALYCDPYDHTSIAMQMLRCLEMPAEERIERLKAAKLHASKFTWKKTAEEMMATINQLLEARKESSKS